MRRTATILAVPAFALGLTACGDQTADLEKNVTDQLSQRGYAEVQVDCPSSGIDIKKGTTFDCEVTDGPVSKVTIRINDDEGQELELIDSQPAGGGTAE